MKKTLEEDRGKKKLSLAKGKKKKEEDEGRVPNFLKSVEY